MTEKSSEKPKLELVEELPPDSIFDDLDALRKDSVISVKRKVIKGTVFVGKPKNNIYFRCHPTISLTDGLVVMGGEGSDDFYYVSPKMKEHHCIAPRLRQVTIAVVYSWPGGGISLWPITKVDSDCRIKCWITAQDAYERSKTKWVQLVWNGGERDYDVVSAEGIHTEPLWPLDLNFPGLLKAGFANRIINTPEHPYVLQLRGLDT